MTLKVLNWYTSGSNARTSTTEVCSGSDKMKNKQTHKHYRKRQPEGNYIRACAFLYEKMVEGPSDPLAVLLKGNCSLVPCVLEFPVVLVSFSASLFLPFPLPGLLS